MEVRQANYEDFFEKIIELKGVNMTEDLKDYYHEFNTIFPSFIASSTGTGKSYFILHTICNECYEWDEKVLYLSNRSGTDLDAKKEYAKANGKENILNENTDVGLRKLPWIGNVCFMTYQKLQKLIDSPIKNKEDIRLTDFKVVVADESEYFLTDSTYNYSTSMTLDFIINNFQNSIRIFITATPDPSFTHIYNRELSKFKKRKHPIVKNGYTCHDCSFTKFKSNIICKGDRCLHYDYDMYLGNNFCCNIEQEFNPTLYTYFKGYDHVDGNCVDSYDKYFEYAEEKKIKSLVYVETKDIGKNAHSKITDSIYIDADTKNKKSKKGNAFNSLIEFELFDENLGIVTSCLDNGINIVDKSLRNIVISSTDKNQAIQMFGRKRVEEGEIVNLIIVNKSDTELRQRLANIKQKLSAIYLFEHEPNKFYEKYFNSSKGKYSFYLVNGIFYIDKSGHICYNDLAIAQLNYLKKTLVEILEKYDNGDEYAYVRTVLSWFEKEYNEDMWLKYKTKEELKLEFKNFLEEIEKCGIIKRKDCKEFRNNLFKKFIATYDLDINESKSEIFGIKKINDKLREYKFQYELLSYYENYYTLKN